MLRCCCDLRFLTLVWIFDVLCVCVFAAKVTRSFGDRRLKAYVSADPEIKSWPLGEGDDFLILASDGVWDVLSSQAAVDIVRQAVAESAGETHPASITSGLDGSAATALGVSIGGGDVKDAARRLTNAAYSYHSMDNITSMVIDLRQFR